MAEGFVRRCGNGGAFWAVLRRGIATAVWPDMARGGGVPQSGTGEVALPRAGIVRPFSFFLREVRVRFRGRELRAAHTGITVDGLLIKSIPLN